MRRTKVKRRTDSGREVPYGWVIVAVTFLISSITWGAQGSFGTFVSPLAEEMGWSRTAISAAFSILIIVNFAVGVFWGWLSDRWSVRGVIAVTGAITGLGIFLTSIADSLWQLYLFYGFVAGVGFGGSTSPLGAIISRWFHGRRGLAIAIGYGGIGAGSATIPILTEHLISADGWRAAFRVLSFILWGIIISATFLLREPRQAAARPGPKTSEASTEASPPVHEQSSPGGTGPRRTSREASIPLSAAVRTSAFWLLFGMETSATVVFFLVLVHLVPRATDQGISSSAAVTLLTVTGIISIFVTLGAGALGDRIGPRRVWIAAMIIELLALVWLIFASSMWMFYVAAIIFGIGYGGWGPQIPATIPRVFGARYMGAIWGAVLLGAGIGGIVGPIMAGYIFDTTGSYQIAFSAGAGVALAGVMLALSLKDHSLGSRPTPLEADSSRTGG